MAYLQDHDNIIPGLEAALEGMGVEDRFRMSIPPADAYGERDDSLIQTLPSSLFQGVDVIEPGMRFQAQTGDGIEVVTVSRRG